MAELLVAMDGTSRDTTLKLLSEDVAGGDAGGGNIRRAALAESGAGAADAGGRSGHGVDVRGGTEYFSAGVGAGDSGGAGVVGVSAGVAPFDEGWAEVLGVSPIED